MVLPTRLVIVVPLLASIACAAYCEEVILRFRNDFEADAPGGAPDGFELKGAASLAETDGGGHSAIAATYVLHVRGFAPVVEAMIAAEPAKQPIVSAGVQT